MGKQYRHTGHTPLPEFAIENAKVVRNINPEMLSNLAVEQGCGTLADCGALVCDTGEFKGRSPKDKYVVRDTTTELLVWWGDVNNPLDTMHYQRIEEDMMEFLKGKDLFMRDVFAGAAEKYRIGVTVITQYPWQDLFVNNLFINPTNTELATFNADWAVLSIPEFLAKPEKHGTKAKNFTLVNFAKRTILIGGSGYTGEIKKGVFTVLNFLLPTKYNVLPMHCSANIGTNNDTAIFFGLSGTGKTTLSADPQRGLIGDDEHGWDNTMIFNFEGGCYAKCIDLSAEKEPQIFNAIKKGTLVENTLFKPGTKTIDFSNDSKTENTRAAYPINYINNAVIPSIGPSPHHIFFLTCDAFGVLPPLSRLSVGQAMFHFLSGYTAKVAGTETGIKDPQATFSACFGEPFLPLNPIRYAQLLGEKLDAGDTEVWLVNTGWTGGCFGTGHRILLKHTRSLITAVMTGQLKNVPYAKHPIFGVEFPLSCPNVPANILDPELNWPNSLLYREKALKLSQLFNDNFKKYKPSAPETMLQGAPLAAYPTETSINK
jgi:phosphoenolpyruvate carboxykinase (ATP)